MTKIHVIHACARPESVDLVHNRIHQLADRHILLRRSPFGIAEMTSLTGVAMDSPLSRSGNSDSAMQLGTAVNVCNIWRCTWLPAKCHCWLPSNQNDDEKIKQPERSLSWDVKQQLLHFSKHSTNGIPCKTLDGLLRIAASPSPKSTAGVRSSLLPRD